MEGFKYLYILNEQGCDFSDFSLIQDYFTLTPPKKEFVKVHL